MHIARAVVARIVAVFVFGSLGCLAAKPHPHIASKTDMSVGAIALTTRWVVGLSPLCMQLP
jgi:hypothetical protein